MARSKRRYPPRICINPLCTKEFIPHDKRQTHCCPQCGTDRRNDERGELEETVYSEVKLLKRIDKILAKMQARLYKEKFCWSHKELLDYEEVDMSLSVKQEMNSDSKKQIRWFFCYGIEFHSDETRFIIHKRPRNEFTKNRK